jgi:hypothetical protein
MMKRFMELQQMSNEAFMNEFNAMTQAGSRHLGTYGVLGRMTEPKDALLNIRSGERVLSPTETAEYNARETATTASAGNTNNSLVQKLLDETKENRVQLVNALNTLHQDMRELQRRQDNTITAIENYA